MAVCHTIIAGAATSWHHAVRDRFLFSLRLVPVGQMDSFPPQ